MPVDVLRTVLGYRHPSGFYFAPALDWVPEGAFADHANTLKVPGYALLGLQTGIDFANGVSLFVDARNLTDEEAREHASFLKDIAPLPGRNLRVGVAYRF